MCNVSIGDVFNRNISTGMGRGATHWLKEHTYEALSYIYSKIGEDAKDVEENERQIFTTLYPDGDILSVELGVFGDLYNFIQENSQKVK